MDIHLTQVIPGIMEVPGRLCCIFLLEWFKRKWSLMLTLFQGAFLCFLSLVLPSGRAPTPQPSGFLKPLPHASSPDP